MIDEQAMNRTEHLVIKARGGDRAALEEVITVSRDQVYNLAIRMLGDPADAEDVTQEILIRIVTALAAFRGDSSFRTWVYRVATNHLLTARKRIAEARMESFDTASAYLDAGVASGEPPLEDVVIVREAKLKCTSGMLLCLDRDHRVAFILGEILDLSAEEGAQILDVTEETFRKRLSRARDRMFEFMKERCSLVVKTGACRCSVQASVAIKNGHIDPKQLRFATHEARAKARDEARLGALEGWARAVEVFRGHPDYIGSSSVAETLKRVIQGDSSGLAD
jgi:RNA polymerase sigma factor (sigma-70 family)